jgi:type IV secretory pathway VirB6-like protein
MNKKLLQIILISFLSLVLNACGQEECKRQCNSAGEHCYRECGSGELECVEADDWGYPKVWVPASSDDPAITVQGKGTYDLPQVSSAIDSSQILLDINEFPLAVAIGRRDQWSSWFGGKDLNPKLVTGKPDPSGWDGGRQVPNIECQYYVTNGTSPGDIKDDLSPSVIYADKDDPNDKFYRGKGDIGSQYHNVGGGTLNRPLYANAYSPCYFRYGMGLYLGLAPDDGVGKTSESNVVFTYHIPDAKYPDKANDNGKYFDNSTQTVKTIPVMPDTNDPNYAQKYKDALDSYVAYSQSAREDSVSNTLYANQKERGMDGYLIRGYAKDELPGAQTGDRLYFKIVDNYYDDNEGGYLVRIKEGTRDPKAGPLETITDVLLDPVRIIMKRLYEGIVANSDYIQFVRGVLALYIVFYGFKFMMGLGSPEEIRKDAVFRILKIAVVVQLISPNSWDFFYNNLFAFFTDGIMNISGFLMNPFGDYDPLQPWYSVDRLLAKFFSAETNAKISSTLISNFPLGILSFITLYLAIILFIRALIKAVVVYIVAFIGIAILVVLAPIFIVFILFEKTKELLEEWWTQLMSFAIQIIMLMAGLGMFAAIIVMFMERTIGYRVCWNIWADFDFIGFNSSNPLVNNAHLLDLRFWMPDISKDMANLWMDVDGDGHRGMQEFAYRYVDLPYFDPVYDVDLIARYMREKNFLRIGDLLIFIGSVFLMLNFMDFIETMAQALKGGGGTQGSASIFGAGNKLMGAMTKTTKNIFGDSLGAAKGTFRLGTSIAASRAGQKASRKARGGAAAMRGGASNAASGAASITGALARGDTQKAGIIATRAARTIHDKSIDSYGKVKDSAKSAVSGTVDNAHKQLDLTASKADQALKQFGTNFLGGRKKPSATGPASTAGAPGAALPKPPTTAGKPLPSIPGSGSSDATSSSGSGDSSSGSTVTRKPIIPPKSDAAKANATAYKQADAARLAKEAEDKKNAEKDDRKKGAPTTDTDSKSRDKKAAEKLAEQAKKDKDQRLRDEETSKRKLREAALEKEKAEGAARDAEERLKAAQGANASATELQKLEAEAKQLAEKALEAKKKEEEIVQLAKLAEAQRLASEKQASDSASSGGMPNRYEAANRTMKLDNSTSASDSASNGGAPASSRNDPANIPNVSPETQAQPFAEAQKVVGVMNDALTEKQNTLKEAAKQKKEAEERERNKEDKKKLLNDAITKDQKELALLETKLQVQAKSGDMDTLSIQAEIRDLKLKISSNQRQVRDLSD